MTQSSTQLETRKTMQQATRRRIVSGARGRGTGILAAGHTRAWREQIVSPRRPVNQKTRDGVEGARLTTRHETGQRRLQDRGPSSAEALPRRNCDVRAGVAITEAARKKRVVTYPELTGTGRRARLVVLAAEVGGRRLSLS